MALVFEFGVGVTDADCEQLSRALALSGQAPIDAVNDASDPRVRIGQPNGQSNQSKRFDFYRAFSGCRMSLIQSLRYSYAADFAESTGRLFGN